MNKILKYSLIAGGSLLMIGTIILVGKKILDRNNGENLPDRKTTKKMDAGSKILFVGDSITAGTGYSYSYLIKNKLTDMVVDILAKGGMQTSWMLTNLPTQLATKKYDRVYIYGGINDMFSGVTEAKAVANVQAMVDLAIKNGADIYVILGYDAKKFMTEKNLKPTIYVPTVAGMIALRDKYIRYQNLLKSSIKNAVIVPQFDLDPSYNSDGIHPTAAAHVLIENILLKNLT